MIFDKSIKSFTVNMFTTHQLTGNAHQDISRLDYKSITDIRNFIKLNFMNQKFDYPSEIDMDEFLSKVQNEQIVQFDSILGWIIRLVGRFSTKHYSSIISAFKKCHLRTQLSIAKGNYGECLIHDAIKDFVSNPSQSGLYNLWKLWTDFPHLRTDEFKNSYGWTALEMAQYMIGETSLNNMSINDRSVVEDFTREECDFFDKTFFQLIEEIPTPPRKLIDSLNSYNQIRSYISGEVIYSETSGELFTVLLDKMQKMINSDLEYGGILMGYLIRGSEISHTNYDIIMKRFELLPKHLRGDIAERRGTGHPFMHEAIEQSRHKSHGLLNLWKLWKRFPDLRTDYFIDKNGDTAVMRAEYSIGKSVFNKLHVEGMNKTFLELIRNQNENHMETL
jgi:hypothetical protein